MNFGLSVLILIAFELIKKKLNLGLLFLLKVSTFFFFSVWCVYEWECLNKYLEWVI